MSIARLLNSYMTIMMNFIAQQILSHLEMVTMEFDIRPNKRMIENQNNLENSNNYQLNNFKNKDKEVLKRN